ncbi:MAG: hypothetical protein MJY97_01065 [Bacteroidales bacterium]|nr:hypothetical protein [Bacteroidales bacterium]
MRFRHIIIAAFLSASCTANTAWTSRETHVDAFRLSDQAVPTLSFDGDSTYTIKDWYGVPGYDVDFVLSSIEDSTVIDILGAHYYDNGFYYVDTGLEDCPTAGISPGLFEPNHTILSGFNGDKDSGRVWSYVYLYDKDMKWVGGHYYILDWGKAPDKPLWTAEGECTMPGDPKGMHNTLEAYADGRYVIRNWYGVDKYNLDFAIGEDGGVRMLDYYAEQDGGVFVQCRRSDIGDPLIPQDRPNGGLELGELDEEGRPVHGRLHFTMTMFDKDDNPMDDPDRPEFIFVW